MLYLYDIALKEHIQKVFKHVYLAERTQLFKKVRDEMLITDKDKSITLPIIGIQRIENTLESDRKNFGEFFRGLKVSETWEDVMRVKSINVPLTYQFDIIAGKYMDCDDLLVDTIVYLSENPYVEFAYKGISFSFSTMLMDLSINTEYSAFSDTGELYNQTLTVVIPEARILFTENKKMFRTWVLELLTQRSKDGVVENIDIFHLPPI